MEKKKLQEEERMYRKEKSHIVKAMDQPLSKLVQRLKETNNYNNQLRDKHEIQHQKQNMWKKE